MRKTKLLKYTLGIIFATLTIGTTAFAKEDIIEIQIAPIEATGWTNELTIVKDAATDEGNVILNEVQCPDGVQVLVTGITNSDYWEVELGQPNKFYIPAAGLSDVKMKDGSTIQTSAGTNTNVTGTTGAVTNTTGTATNVTTGYIHQDEEDYVIARLIQRYDQYGPSFNLSEADIQEARRLYKCYRQALDRAMADPRDSIDFYSDDSIYTTKGMIHGEVHEFISELYPKFTFTSAYTFAPEDTKAVVYRNGYLPITFNY